MKIKLDSLLIIIFVLSAFGSGVIFQVILIGCLLFLAVGSKKYCIEIIGRSGYDWLLFYIWIFIVLFVFQIILVRNVTGSGIIRLFGLTRNICAPAFLFIIFSKHVKKIDVFSMFTFFLIVLNLIYEIQTVAGSLVFTPVGSVNILNGIDAVFLPTIILYIRKKATHIWLYRILLICSIVNFFLLVSTTYQMIVAIFIIIYAISRIIRKNGSNKWISYGILGVGILAIFVSVFTVRSGVDFFNGTLHDRVNIWIRGYSQFLAGSPLEHWIGKGDNMVQMVSKTLAGHNMLMEALLTYGYIGCIMVIILFIALIFFLFKIRKDYSNFTYITICSTVLAYIFVCMMHPVFSGVFIFQIFSVVCFINILLLKSTATQVSNKTRY